jgi:hypothetical protein
MSGTNSAESGPPQPPADNSNFDPFKIFEMVFGSAFVKEVLSEQQESEKDEEVRKEARHPALDKEPQLELKLDHVRVWPLDSIKPAPENDDVYNAISWDDPETLDRL